MKDKEKASMQMVSDEVQEVTGPFVNLETESISGRTGFLNYSLIMVEFSESFSFLSSTLVLITLRQQPCIKVNVRFVHSTAIAMPAPPIFQRLCAFQSTSESEEQIGSRYQPGDLIDQID